MDPHWEPDELVRAAHFYHDYLEERLSPEELRRARLRWWLHPLEARLDLARFIESGVLRAKVDAAGRRPLAPARVAIRRWPVPGWRSGAGLPGGRPAGCLPRRPYTSVVDASRQP